MARPQKDGLDYFSLDVHNDDKLDLIEAKYGIEGYGIIIRLWKKIYSTGYWYEWTENKKLLFKKSINVDLELLDNIIDDAIHFKIFDKKMFETYHILTSNGIQKRYLEGITRRKNRRFIKEYCLFDVNEYINSQDDNTNIEIVDTGTQSKVKYSKVKYSKVKESKVKHKYGEYKNILLTDKELERLKKDYGEQETLDAIEYLSNWGQMKNKKFREYSDHNLVLRKWVFDAIKKGSKSKMQQTYDSAMEKYGDQI